MKIYQIKKITAAKECILFIILFLQQRKRNILSNQISKKIFDKVYLLRVLQLFWAILACWKIFIENVYNIEINLGQQIQIYGKTILCYKYPSFNIEKQRKKYT